MDESNWRPTTGLQEGPANHDRDRSIEDVEMSEPQVPDDRLRIWFQLVPPHLRPVLAALLSGATDAAACHRLNVSPRTYSRRLAELLEYFEVQTRFQAGVQIGVRGSQALTYHSGPALAEGRPTGGVSGEPAAGSAPPLPYPWRPGHHP